MCMESVHQMCARAVCSVCMTVCCVPCVWSCLCSYHSQVSICLQLAARVQTQYRTNGHQQALLTEQPSSAMVQVTLNIHVSHLQHLPVLPGLPGREQSFTLLAVQPVPVHLPDSLHVAPLSVHCTARWIEREKQVSLLRCRSTSKVIHNVRKGVARKSDYRSLWALQ